MKVAAHPLKCPFTIKVVTLLPCMALNLRKPCITKVY